MILTLLPISIIALPFPKRIRVPLTTPFWILFFKCIIRFVFVSKVTTIDRRPENEQKTFSPKGLYICNHQSFTDIPLMFSHFVIPPIMKKEVIWIPLFGICAYSAGGILVNRKDKDSRKKVFEESKQRLSTGRKQLQYYPEGTRQQGNLPPLPVSKIKSALIEYAYDENIPVYPVSIEGTQHTMDKADINPFKPLGIIFHEPVQPQDVQNKDEFLVETWNKVAEGKKELERIIYQ